MQFATFEDYKEYLQGRAESIPETDFNFWATEASSHVYIATLSRLGNEETLNKFKGEVIRATCAVVELLYKDNAAPKVKSQSIGSFSQSFVDEKTAQDEINAIMRRELGMTGLLFRGI